mgnify:CR=1 FL=1
MFMAIPTIFVISIPIAKDIIIKADEKIDVEFVKEDNQS